MKNKLLENEIFGTLRIERYALETFFEFKHGIVDSFIDAIGKEPRIDIHSKNFDKNSIFYISEFDGYDVRITLIDVARTYYNDVYVFNYIATFLDADQHVIWKMAQ